MSRLMMMDGWGSLDLSNYLPTLPRRVRLKNALDLIMMVMILMDDYTTALAASFLVSLWFLLCLLYVYTRIY